MQKFLCKLAAVTCAAVLSANALSAQDGSIIDKGSWIVGGTGSISRTSNDNEDSGVTNLSVTPTLLYFFAPRLAIGGSAVLGLNSGKGVTANQLGIGPSARFYLTSGPNRLRPYLGATVFLNRNSQTVEDNTPPGSPDIKTTSRDVTIDGAFGLTYMLGDEVGLLAEAYFAHRGSKLTSVPDSDTFKSKAFGLRFGFNMFLK